MRTLIVVVVLWAGSAALAQVPDTPEPRQRSPLVESIQGVADAVRATGETSLGEQNRAIRDVNAQEQMARYALWMAWISAAGTVISGVAVVGVYFSLRQTGRAINLDEGIGRAQVRAYLSIRRISFEVSEDRTLAVGLIIANSGQSPSKRTHFVAKVGYVIMEDGCGRSGSIFNGPWLIGEIGAGQVKGEGRPFMFQSSEKLPQNIRLEDDVMGLTLSVGVFGKDVFKKEVSCFETVIVYTKPNVMRQFDQFLPFTSDIEELEKLAWTGACSDVSFPSR